jgi:hypothetical protein
MTKEIKLTREAVTIVDDEDFDFLNQYKWFLSAGYATRSAFLNEKSTSKQMHVYIAERMGLDMSLLMNNKYTYIGTFASEIEAAKAYNAKAIKYFGEHAYLNPIEESNGQA